MIMMLLQLYRCVFFRSDKCGDIVIMDKAELIMTGRRLKAAKERGRLTRSRRSRRSQAEDTGS